MPATYYIHIGLQCKVGDHTTLHAFAFDLPPVSESSRCN